MATKCSGSKRRDHKGRILRTGESQRADLTYQYRYTDSSGTRHYIYNPDLHALREEVKHIQVKLNMGIDYAKGNITVLELAKKYIGLKELGVKRNTRLCYAKVVRCLERSCLAKMKIRDVKMSDVKKWFIDLSNEGLSRSVLKQIRGIMRPAFEMALQEDAVHKNPFNFTINFVPDTTQSRNEDQLPHTTAHNLRHSFCTNLLDAEMNPKNVQYLMGHASITVTMNVYAHSSSEKAELDFLRVASTLD